jgi:hypothetical protein
MDRIGVFGRRLLISVDTQGYGQKDDLRQASIQRDLLAVLDEAAERAMLARPSWLRQPAGDGELSILPETESEPHVVDDFARELSAVLARHNEDLCPDMRLRLRLAVHHGVAMRAGNGFSGQGVVEVSRLVDSRPLRQALKVTDADLAVILSGRVFLDTVVQRHTSLRAAEFRKVRIRNKEYDNEAWLRVPGADVHALDLPEQDELPAAVMAEAAPTEPSGPVLSPAPEAVTPPAPQAAPPVSATPARTNVKTTINGDFITDKAVFGVSNER